MMNGMNYQAGKYAGAMRRRIFREHLGLLESAEGDSQVRDPVSDDFYHGQWQATAKRNTEIYEKVHNLVKHSRLSSYFS